MIPIYRGSDLDAFATCPFKFGCSLLRKATNQDKEPVRDYLLSYCCPQGADYIMEHCGSTPMPLQSRMTAIGSQFHTFAHAYGTYLKQHNLTTDWDEADRIARGLATVDGDFVKQIYDTCTFWYQQFEHNPQTYVVQDADVDLTSGSFERGHELKFKSGDKECIYSMHPDFAKLSGDLKRLTIMDWKSGMRQEVYNPDRPDKQLLRYAWAFSKLYSSITEVEMHLVFVNPRHPLSEEPLIWVRDLQELEISDEIVTAPVAAIAASPEFRSSVGCWLCEDYCEWALYCDEGDAVSMINAVDPQTALEAYKLHEETFKVSGLMSAKRRDLKRIMDAYVNQNGPLVVGEDGQGRPIEYGPKRVLAADVRDMPALVQELQAKGRQDIIAKLKLEGARELADEMGGVGVFGETPMDNLRIKWRVTNSTIGVQDEDAPIIIEAPKKKRKAKDAAEPCHGQG